ARPMAPCLPARTTARPGPRSSRDWLPSPRVATTAACALTGSRSRSRDRMLTKEQNQRFTEVGQGTPMGELLRRYWMPFATVKQLHEHPTRAITLLGEHLVAFKDRSGQYGLIQEHCPHRNTNLLWGIPENEGLRCPYHGWLFDTEGHCLEQPAESPDSTFKD